MASVAERCPPPVSENRNRTRFFGWDPFRHTARVDATVGALRARARDAGVDTTRMPKAEWKRQNEAAGIGLFPTGAQA